MLVIQRNGRTTVITGWRAWLVAAALFVGLTLLFALIAFLVLGIAITLGAVLLIVVPVAVGVAILASLFQPRRR
jgi:ABC-type multidrug transport system permease subunit